MAYDREAARKQLEARQKESAARAGSSGFIGVLKGDLPTWKAGEGKHKIDILPFVVGKKHPTLKKGEYDYKMDVWVHSNIGVDNAQYLCLHKMFDQDCPICNYRAQLQQEGEDDKDKIKALQPKHNCLYNIICYDSNEQEKKGIQLWLINAWNMEDRLQELADDESGERVLFPDPSEGKRISFKRTGTGATNTRYTAHAFVDRDYKITEKLLDKTFTLDECIVIPTEAEVEKAFFGGLKKKEKEVDIGDDNEDKDNKKSFSKIPSEDDIEEMTRKELKNLIEDLGLDIDPDDDKFEEKDNLRKAVVKAVKSLGKKKDDDDDKDVPEEKGKEIPSKDDIEDMSRKELKVVIKEHDLSIDPDDDDYEEKEALQKAVLKAFGFSKDKKKEKTKEKDEEPEEKEDKKSDDKEPKCFVKKGTFGADFDKFTECLEDCPHFDACSDAFDALKKDKKDKKLNRR